MRTILIVMISIGYIQFCSGQDLKKLKKTSEIICDCLNNFSELEMGVKNCGKVLSDGLSVLESEAERKSYASIVEVLLQKNCLKYLQYIKSKDSISTIDLINRTFFNKSFPDRIQINEFELPKVFYYKDFSGSNVYIEIKDDELNEYNEVLKTIVTFKRSENELFFIETNDDFYKYFYDKEEKLDYYLVKIKNQLYFNKCYNNEFCFRYSLKEVNN